MDRRWGWRKLVAEAGAGLLDRLVRRGFLEKRMEDDQLGQPNAYRPTTRALAMMGHATLESFQAWCHEQMSKAASS
jgi:hypothetical protein